MVVVIHIPCVLSIKLLHHFESKTATGVASVVTVHCHSNSRFTMRTSLPAAFIYAERAYFAELTKLKQASRGKQIVIAIRRG